MPLLVKYFYILVQTIVAVVLLYAAYQYPGKFVRVSGRCWIPVDATEGTQPLCCPAPVRSSSIPTAKTLTESISPCYAMMETVNVFTSPLGAWTIPFIGLGLTVVTGDWSKRSLNRAGRRALLYLGLMAYRLVALYIGLNIIQEAFFQVPEPQCWYLGMRANKTCGDAFDFADHVVLFLVHFISIGLFEVLAAAVETGAYNSRLALCFAWFLGICGTSMHFLYQTALSFHSAEETIVAWVISLFAVILPLYFIITNRLPGSGPNFFYFVAPKVASSRAD